ncbi:Stk1 family PASTA domain-containing Ser/Thr kinase [Ornithinimicrobium cryptoxanthini]|uniref:non-specific serine/threonine protein kinase n=1 Tax=Ornithinimicrobium cryptoxanthini TaxID=2934161 RepID=A0ABY4YIP6_9MICO|nr:Stk1 family PASTA domain-containing Ser/Thr kinase [Ornithinimicrobium cryptoxanthini]USQ76380.1 Stk1 family PASTA domain-containing Ser/Thr kinase [Ornithinimicrobium cryptoxanthini]
MSEETLVLGGRYEVGELVGRGGMAEVHRGHDLRLGRTVAIKILRSDLARDTSFLARFRREAQSAAGLNHPSIVAVYDSGEQEMRESGGAPVSVPYIVMELVEGQTLRDILNHEKVLDPDEAARVTAAVLSALAYSHERGIVHRDIKPANVMITRGGAVKVMDFGIARALADTAATMTQTQSVLGTARYLSPEQAQGEDVDARSDLYSTGCLLFELLTGRTPFVGDPVSLVYQHLGEQAKAPSSFQGDLSESLDAITLHALRKSPDERYQTADEFREDLNAARAGHQVSATALASLGAAAGAPDVLSGGAVPPSGFPTEAVYPARGEAPRRPQGDRRAQTSAAAAYDDGYERTDEIPVREQRHSGGWLVLSVLALLALAGIGWVTYQALGPQADDVVMVAVPHVIGDTEADAETAIRARNLGVGEAIPQADDSSAGTVLDQDPPANQQVPEGTEIVLTVSSGPDSIVIPDVEGNDEASARSILEARELTVAAEVIEEDNPAYDEGIVIRTEPAEGTPVAPDDPVTLVVASGQTEVPDVEGKDIVDASVELREARLVTIREEEARGDVEPGTVLSQSVEAGEIVVYDTEVTLVVAIAPPDVVTVEPPRETVTVGPPEPTETEPEPTETEPDPSEPTTGPTTGPTDPPDPTETGPTETTPPPDD